MSELQFQTPSPPITTRSRKRMFALMALLLSSFVAVVTMEVALRLVGFAPDTPAKPHVAKPEDLHPNEFIREAQLKNWILPPRHAGRKEMDEHSAGTIVFRRNDCSFREDQDTPITKPDGVYRVFVVGDSHTDGVCFNNESYPNRLERLLAQSRDKPTFEVINAGQTGFSPYQEWWLYEKVGRHFSPNLIIVGFYAGNDYWELTKHDRVHLRSRGDTFEDVDPAASGDSTGAARPLAREQVFASSMRSFLRNHSAIYNAIVRIAPLRAMIVRAEHTDINAPILLLKEEANGSYFQSLGQAYHFAHHPEDLDRADAVWGAVLQRFRDSAERDGARLLILMIPSLRDIAEYNDPPQIQLAVKTLGLTDSQTRLDSEVADRAIQQAKRLSLDVIDLRPDLRKAYAQTERPLLYYKFDQHLTPAANEIVAEVLAQHLKSIIAESDSN